MIRAVTSRIGGHHREGVGALGFVIRISSEGNDTRCGINGEGGCIVVVAGLEAVGEGAVVGSRSGVDGLSSATVFINGCCRSSRCEGWSGGIDGDGQRRRGIGGQSRAGCDRHQAIVLERICEGHHTGLQLIGNAAAITAPAGVSPGDDGAVVFQCREGVISGEDLGDAGAQLAADAAAITAPGAPPGDDGAVVFQCREGGAGGEDLGDAGAQLAADAAAITAPGAPPGDDGAVVFQCREGGAGGEDLGDAGAQLAADAAAVTAGGGISPGDDGAVVFQCREGTPGGEDLGDAGAQLAADAAAVTAVGGMSPGDDGAIVFQCSKGVIITPFLSGSPWRGNGDGCGLKSG